MVEELRLALPSKSECGNHLDRFPCSACGARVPMGCPRYAEDRLAAPQQRAVDGREAVEHAFKEAYQLGFLEGYVCEPRHNLDEDGTRAALLQCDGTSEAWSDYLAALKALAQKEKVG